MTQGIVLKFFLIQTATSFIFGIGGTFILLDFIDEFGFHLAGMLFALSVLVQLITDYPSGSLADYVGQRIVIAISLIFYFIAYILIGQQEGLFYYILASIFLGLAAGQMSGAMQTYLDNNYKKTVGGLDTDRKMYGYTHQRMRTLSGYFSAVSFILGGILSTVFSRKLVFSLVGVLSLTLVPVVVYFLKDITDNRETLDENSDNKSYAFYLRGGLQFVFSSRVNFFLIFGIAITFLADSVWYRLVLFPLYFTYTGSDAGVGALRAFLLIAGYSLQAYTAKYSKSINNSKFGLLSLINYCVWFLSIMALILVIPPNDTFNIVGIIFLLGILILTLGGLMGWSITLRQRVLAISVPSEYRNSVYSLFPTITMIFQIPMLIVTGTVMESGGIFAGLEVVLIIGVIGSLCLLLYHYFDRERSGVKVGRPTPGQV